MVVVSDTSPVINLAAIGIGYWDLLPDLFTEIVVPNVSYTNII